MKKNIIKNIFIFLFFIPLLLINSRVGAEEFSHIEELFEIRSEITDQGKTLPDYIKKATGNDLRTLERIFELNTSVLTTIEAYFRLFKIAISNEDTSNSGNIEILNDWLSFIKNQCQYDLDYLNEALKETRDLSVVNQLNTARDSIRKLSSAAATGINENTALVTSP